METRFYDILFQPQKNMISRISDRGEDIDGDATRPIHLLKGLTKSQYKKWIRKNQDKCLVVVVSDGINKETPAYYYAHNPIAERFFWSWFGALINGTAGNGAAILMDYSK